jgi:hypothetical protein
MAEGYHDWEANAPHDPSNYVTSHDTARKQKTPWLRRQTETPFWHLVCLYVVTAFLLGLLGVLVGLLIYPHSQVVNCFANVNTGKAPVTLTQTDMINITTTLTPSKTLNIVTKTDLLFKNVTITPTPTTMTTTTSTSSRKRKTKVVVVTRVTDVVVVVPGPTSTVFVPGRS